MAAAPTTAIGATSGGGGVPGAALLGAAAKVGSTAIKLDGAELGRGAPISAKSPPRRAALGCCCSAPAAPAGRPRPRGPAGADGGRVEGEGRAALFSQDLAQELDQEATALDAVLRRAPPPTRRARGAWRLQAQQRRGAAAIGARRRREARVALACFALSEINVLL